ncbi:MAG: hypothetical protein C5B60_05515 [Chloroflexi bacterium]|nr:MAG: hypothetical protein C5B60_05515 [Chloroflexota bacterium]
MGVLAGGPGRTAGLALARPARKPVTRKHLLPSGKIRYSTWGAALQRFEEAESSPAIPPAPPRRAPWRPSKIPKRYLRRSRIKYKNPRPGWVALSIHGYIPPELNLRLRQLCAFDDRTLLELTILGLTWVCTEWAGKRASEADLARTVPLSFRPRPRAGESFVFRVPPTTK